MKFMKLKLLKILITFYVNIKNVVSSDSENNENNKILNKIVNSYIDTINESKALSHLFKEKLQDNTIILWDSNGKDKELEIIQKYKNLIFDTKD